MKILIKYIFYLFINILLCLDNSAVNSFDGNILNTKYFFILNIPTINLSEKVYYYNDDNNNVDKGIYLAKDYDFKTLNGSIILASHSGNSEISYFKNLHLLKKDDVVNIECNGSNYFYKIDKKYKINKNGKFKYNNDDRTIYLITCDKKNKKKQLVFMGKIIKVTKKSTFF